MDGKRQRGNRRREGKRAIPGGLGASDARDEKQGNAVWKIFWILREQSTLSVISYKATKR
jgi:hypothetical protein